MMTLDHTLIELYQAGEITYDTAMTYARHPENLKKKAGA